MASPEEEFRQEREALSKRVQVKFTEAIPVQVSLISREAAEDGALRKSSFIFD